MPEPDCTTLVAGAKSEKPGLALAKTCTTEGEAVWNTLIVVRSASVRSARGVTARGDVAETQNATA